jgi:hypothetical protein
MTAREDESLGEARFELANEPTIQFFLGGLLKKAKRAVKSGIDLVKKGMREIRLQPILKKLAGLVRPLIQRVLKFALHQLPARLRPAATWLALRVLGENTAPLSQTFDAEVRGNR